MKATVSRTEHQNKVKTGMFSSTMVPSYTVSAAVQFSEEELAIIRKQKIGSVVVHTCEQGTFKDGSPITFDYTIDFIVKNGSFGDSFKRMIDAGTFERKLKEDILPTLKGFIAGNENTGNTSETLEF